MPLTEHQSREPIGLGISQASDQLPRARTTGYDDVTSTCSESSKHPLLHPADPSMASPSGHSHNAACPTKKKIVQGRNSWIPMTLIILACYSTLFSGIFVVVAIQEPRYGRLIGQNGSLTLSTANNIGMLIAKTTELAYVTICVAFLGEVLSRRAITKGSRGISIADMSMRSWIMQPGTMVVHWHSLRYSGLTVLGVIALVVTFVAMLYTTAAEALVFPKLNMGPIEHRMLVAEVRASFANPTYIKRTCKTPLVDEPDGATCVDMNHAGQAFHNYQAFLQTWSDIAENSSQSASATVQLTSRPSPTGSFDGISVNGSWIDSSDHGDIAELSQKHGRLVHNVTAALPHAGIVRAATYEDNGIHRPKDDSGEGRYELEASVPSPAINVLCVGMNETELKPLVYSEMPYRDTQFNDSRWAIDIPSNMPYPSNWTNRTVVDEIMQFGPDYPGQDSPIFGKLPKPNNIVVNIMIQGRASWWNPAIYLLGALPKNSQPEYVLCSLKAKQTPKCSTRYTVNANSSQLTAICEQGHPLQYSTSNPAAPDGVWENDWKNIASTWATTLSLNDGITDGMASSAKLLMQFVPGANSSLPSLNPTRPSLGEALAVLAGNTLLQSTIDAPLVPTWNYTLPFLAKEEILNEPATQICNATFRCADYASGGSHRWQLILFSPILLLAFSTSALVLAFMLLEVRGTQMTDFTEPQNLFALAVNSPPTARLRGACGAGPDGAQLAERFFVAMEEEDEHYYIRSKAEEDVPIVAGSTKAHSVSVAALSDSPTPSKSTGSPVLDEYRWLSERKSWVSKFY
ncbi:hypothetical protein BDW74DRAFT_167622 [Aspergillus multicolor]|uniref:uncharacterized protein n=1 Tax=Aspergillus multicolor TaxID=41759 RepID=UPI003CCD4EAB